MTQAGAEEEVGAPGGLGARLLDNLSTAVVLLDAGLCLRYANPAAEQLLATSVVHLLGQPAALFFDAEGWSESEVRAALAYPHPLTRREAQLLSPGHGVRPRVDYTVTPLADADGRARQLLMELLPLERQQRLSREDGLLAAHQATRALVRGMAHEIKNPLGGIRGAAQLLGRALHDSDLQDYTAVIISETDRLRALVDRMLGPRQPPACRWINIHQVLERVRVVLQAETGAAVVFERDYDPSLPELWGDFDQLIQVVLNIVRNAVQALQENPRADGAPARIVLRSRALRQFTLGGVRHRLVCLVEVHDNGPGIAAEMLATLFYPMVTGRAQGTGLGLPIAQAIVQQHGGLIECDSRPGHTVFRVLLPFAPSLPVHEPGKFL